jgi:hypothetical protein
MRSCHHGRVLRGVIRVRIRRLVGQILGQLGGREEVVLAGRLRVVPGSQGAVPVA